jgi:hypothetical protein
MLTSIEIRKEIYHLINEVPENKLVVLYDFINYLKEKRITDEEFLTSEERQRILNNIREACHDIKAQEAGFQSEQTLEEFIDEFSDHSN